MRQNIVGRKASQVLKTLNYEISETSLTLFLEKIGWRVFVYNGIDGDGDILLKVIDKVGYAQSKESFLYNFEDKKYIFIKETAIEQVIITRLLHEIGHVVLGHYNNKSNSDLSSNQENEANMFLFEITKHGDFSKIKQNRRLKNLFKLGLLAVFTLGILIYYNENIEKQFYITTTGNRYHLITCQTLVNSSKLLNINKVTAYKLRYSACKICFPD